jgi:hypothetical protein
MRQEATRELFAYWTTLKAGRNAPERSALDPSMIRSLLRDMFILARGPGQTWHYRLAGTRLTALAGRELRGLNFDAWWSVPDRRDVGRMLATVATDATPLVAGVEATAIEANSVDAELLLLPLCHEGHLGERVLGGLFPGAESMKHAAWHADRLSLVSLRIVGAESAFRTSARKGIPPNLPSAPRDMAVVRRQGLRVIAGGRRDADVMDGQPPR